MSTQYTILRTNVYALELSEESGKISVGVYELETDNHVWTEAVFTDDDLIKAVIKILKVASYVAEDSHQTVAKLVTAISQDYYLGSMPLNISH